MNQGPYGGPQSQQGYGPPPQHYPQAYYGAPQPTPPRDHPSAQTALVLGLLGTFCVGALTGIPAIIVGRRVAAAITQEPHRWRGMGTAQAGVVLGWISVFETAAAISTMTTHTRVSAVFGIAFGVIGLSVLALSALKNLPKPIAVVSGALRRAPLAVGLTLAGVLAGSGFSLPRTLAAEQLVVQRCTTAHADHAAAVKAEGYAAARAAIDEIQGACKATDTELTTMRREVDAREVDTVKRKQEEARALQAKLAAEKEANAVAAFPEKSKQITATLTASQAKAWQGKVEASAEDLDAAQRELDQFKGTSVEQVKGFTDLAGQVAAKRKAIQPQLARNAEARRKAEAVVEDKRRKEEVAAALKAAIRGPMPTNSAWDGSVPAVERYLKMVLNDPGSYDHVRTSAVSGEGDYWVVVSSFRGKNAFGGLVLNVKKFYIQQGQVVKTADVGGDDD